jgi:hypothetical protein
VHELALVELHVSSEEPPLGTAVGFALSAAVGTMSIVTLAGLLLLCAPEHLTEYVALVESGPTDRVPEAARLPLQAPEPVQLVACMELHVSVEVPPLLMVVGVALIAAVGGGSPLSLPPQDASNSEAQSARPKLAERRRRGDPSKDPPISASLAGQLQRCARRKIYVTPKR